MRQARIFVARLLVALALIVQIAAPVGASTSMAAAATDPLAGAWICGPDGHSTDGGSPAADACRLCDLVCHGNGFAPTPPVATLAEPAALIVDVVRPAAIVDFGLGLVAVAFLARGPPRTA